MRGLALRALGAALLALALIATPARAEETTHPFLFSLSGTTPPPPLTPPPYFNYSPDGGFEDACGLAVDSEGDIYLADYYHHAVDVYSSSGFFLTQIKAEDPEDGPCALAVDSAGNLYVNNYHRNVVKLTPSSYPPTTSTSYGAGAVIDSAHSTGVAIDPASGRLYVDDGTYLAAYEAPVLPGGEPIKIGLGTLGEGYGVAVSAFPATKGFLYVPDAAARAVKVYDPAADPVNPAGAIDGQGTPQAGFDSLTDSAIAVDQADGHVYVADDLQKGSEHAGAVIDEFSVFGNYRGQLPHALTEAKPLGLAVDESAGPSRGSVYVTSGNEEGSLLYAFGPAPAPPPSKVLTVTRTGAGAVTSSPKEIYCPSACAGEFGGGAKVTLSAKPSERSTFTGFSGAGCAGSGPCEVTLGEDTSLSAEFAPIPQHTLSVAKKGAGAGTVAGSSPGAEFTAIACGGTCAAEYNQGATVTLVALAAPGSAFLGFSGPCTGAGPCEVSLAEDAKVSAEFASVPPVPPSDGGNGSGGSAKSSAPAALRLGKLTVKGTSVTLEAAVSGAGELAASGKGLRRAVAHPGSAGEVSLRLALNGAGKRALRAKHGRLGVKVTVAFTPSGGANAVLERKTVSFGAKGRGAEGRLRW